MDDHYGNCPHCGVSWDGGDIPEDIREHYSEPYKWSRLILVQMQGDDPSKDESYYQCPDCNQRVLDRGA